MELHSPSRYLPQGIKSLVGLMLLLLYFPGNAQNQKAHGKIFDRADTLYSQNDYPEAIEQYNLYIEEEKKSASPDQNKISISLNNIGTCYHNLNNFEEAIIWYKLAMAMDKEMDSARNIATCYGNIGLAYQRLSSLDSAFKYYRDALALSQEIGDDTLLSISLNNLGQYYTQKAIYDSAISYHQRSLEVKKKIGDSSSVANSLNNIGLLYNKWEKYDLAIEYLNEALRIDSLLGAERDFANKLNNKGISYYKKGDYDIAIGCFTKALKLSEENQDLRTATHAYNNLGMSYLQKKDYEQSRNYLNKALDNFSASGQKAPVAQVLSNLAKISYATGNLNLSLDYLSQSTEIAESLDLLDMAKENYLKFSDIYASMGNYSEALKYYKKYIAIKDTLYSEAIHKQITDFEIRYETEKKDNEIRLLKQKEEIQALKIKKQRILRNSLYGGITFSLLLAAVIFISLNRRRRDNRIIASEKAKTDKLLLNVLPASIASDLKEKGSTEPRLYKNVTVCFTDMVGFTEKSTKLEPKFLIEELNTIFTAFDNIIERNGCERIKTIGDSYMSLCGLPEPNPNHAENMIRTAVEMVQYIEKRNLESPVEWKIRVGIHSGDVIAGVVGIKKYIYDVFGDTINTASRMETASAPMRINVSENTYQLLKDKFKFEERGELEVKGKGVMKMYFIKV